MMLRLNTPLLSPFLLVLLLLVACQPSAMPGSTETVPTTPVIATEQREGGLSLAPARPDIFASVKLSSDLSHLSQGQREMVALLIEASQVMDQLFWLQAWGDKSELLETISDPGALRFAQINYGPWDRMDGDKAFIAGVGPKPPGAGFYPADMSKAEFEAWSEPDKKGHYSLVRRNAAGALALLPFHQAYATPLAGVAVLLR